MEIRKCLPEEADRAGAFYDRAVLALENGENYPKWEYKKYPSTAYARESADKGELFLCMDGAEIVGVYVLNDRPGGAYERGNWQLPLKEGEYLVIHAFAVAPERIGQHIGSFMLEEAVAYAKRRGFRAVRVDVVPGNTPAMRFYKSAGFISAGEVDLMRGHPEIPTFALFELPLDMRGAGVVR